MKEIYCPRCDRRYSGLDAEALETRMRRHVAAQHPDHDPLWFETGPGVN